MRIAKILGAIMGALLLLILIPVALGMISRSPMFVLVVIALCAVTVLIVWMRR